MVFKTLIALALCHGTVAASDGIRMEIEKDLGLHRATGASDLKQHLITLASRAEPKVSQRYHNMAASFATNITESETSLVKTDGITVPLVNVLNS